MFRIAGLVTKDSPPAARRRLAVMLGAMKCSASEAVRSWDAPEIGAYLGWFTPGDGPPTDGTVISDNDRLLLWSGEHFGTAGDQNSERDASLQRRLLSGGDILDLPELNGWFAGVIADVDRGFTRVFCDRFGLRRLYYALDAHGFAFASEAKALLAVHGAPRWSMQSIADFVACGCVLQDRTLFDGINVLPAASSWTITPDGQPTRTRYFVPSEWEGQPELGEREYFEALSASLRRVIPKYLSGSVGLSLTGGLDSRIIAAFAPRDANLATYTFAGMYRDCYDATVGAQVASVCGYPHRVLRITHDFLDDFPSLARRTVQATDGTADIAASHEIYLSRLAAQIAPIRVTGNFGSEILRGVTSLRHSPERGLANEDLFPYLQHTALCLREAQQSHPVSFVAFRELPWRLFGRLNAGQSELTPRSPFTDLELVRLAYRAPASVRRSSSHWNEMIAQERPPLRAVPTDRGDIAGVSPLKNFFARTASYALFKADWYYEGGTPDWLCHVDRRLSSPLFFTGYHKIENYRRWYQKPLAAFLASVLESTSSEHVPGIDWHNCRALVASHAAGRSNSLGVVTKAVTLALVHETLVRPHAAFTGRGNRTADIISVDRSTQLSEPGLRQVRSSSRAYPPV